MAHTGMRNVSSVAARKHQGQRDHFEDLHVDGTKILKMNLTKIWWEGMDWTHLAQDRQKWWDLANMIMNLWIPRNHGIH